jgi:hypothetical protein
MPEWIPIAMSFCLGSPLHFAANRRVRVVSAGIGIVLIASAAFVMGREYDIGWTYFVIDLMQALVRFIAGILAAQFIGRAPSLWRRGSAVSD